MIKTPERPEDVKQEHIDYVATEIMGFTKALFGKRYLDHKKRVAIIFNPFTKIEHAKMVEDKFFNKHEELWIMILNNSPDFTAILYEKDFQTDIKTQEYDEAFVRMTTTLKAHQKLKGGEGG